MITNSKKKITDPEGPASPVYTDWQKKYDGLTKREYFAAMAMQGLLACEVKAQWETFAEWSVDMADALIKVLNKKDE